MRGRRNTFLPALTHLASQVSLGCVWQSIIAVNVCFFPTEGHCLWLPPTAVHQVLFWRELEPGRIQLNTCLWLPFSPGRARLQDEDRDRHPAMSICSSQISHWAGIWSLFEHLRACSSLWFDGLDNYFHCQVWVRWPTPPPSPQIPNSDWRRCWFAIVI